MIQRIRTFGIDWSCSAMNWVSDAFLSEDDYSQPVTLRNRIGWWLEAQLSRVFGFFWSGSDEEIESALNGETPRRCMSERQRKFAHAGLREDLKWSSFFGEFFCADCDAELLVEDTGNLCADCRALHPELLLEDRK